MSQQQYDETEKLIKMDKVIEQLELETQKSISMTKLGIDIKTAFEEPFLLLEKINDIFIEIEDAIVKTIAVSKVRQAYDEFDSKLEQVR